MTENFPSLFFACFCRSFRMGFIAQLAILPFEFLFHDISFYYKYMVGTERMYSVVENFSSPILRKSVQTTVLKPSEVISPA